MGKVAVVYWSGTGNTEKMANHVAAGAKAEGVDADIIQASDFNAGKVANYSAIAFGCPSMGDEVLEEEEFEPMFTDVEGSLESVPVGLFGSYGWGDGEWMRQWEDRCRSKGIKLVSEGVMANESPDVAAETDCKNLGGLLARS